MLDLFQQDQAISSRPGPEEGRDLPTTFGESFSDAWQTGQLAASFFKQENARNQAIREFSDQINAAGGDVETEYGSRTPTLGGPGGSVQFPDPLDVANTALAKLKAKNPMISLDPMSEQDIDKRSGEIAQEALQAHARMDTREQGPGSTTGRILGGLASGLADPSNILLLAVNPESSVGIAATAAIFGGVSAATQAANEAVNASWNERIQPGYGERQEAVGNILEAGVVGSILGGGVKALGNVLTRLSTGEWPTAVRDAANVVKSEAQVQGSNVLPGIEGEAAHSAALGKAIEDVLAERPVDVSRETAGFDPAAHIDVLMDARSSMAEQLAAMREMSDDAFEQRIAELAKITGYDMPKEEAAALSDRVLEAKSDEEAQFIAGQIADRPQTILDTTPPSSAFRAEEKAAEAAEAQPAIFTPEMRAEALQAPQAQDAMRADIERAIDEAAAKGKALRVPLGVDLNGEPIFQSAGSALDQIDAYKALAQQIAACAMPGAAAAGE